MQDKNTGDNKATVRQEQDRGYLWGRLLGALDELEAHHLRGKNKKMTGRNTLPRPTNAQKFLYNLKIRPLQTFAEVERRVNALGIKGAARTVAERWIKEIMSMIGPEDDGRRLDDDRYLLGFYHQKNNFWEGCKTGGSGDGEFSAGQEDLGARNEDISAG